MVIAWNWRCIQLLESHGLLQKTSKQDMQLSKCNMIGFLLVRRQLLIWLLKYNIRKKKQKSC